VHSREFEDRMLTTEKYGAAMKLVVCSNLSLRCKPQEGKNVEVAPCL